MGILGIPLVCNWHGSVSLVSVFGVTEVLFGVPAAQGCWLLQEKHPESSCAHRFRLSSEVC